MEKGELMTGQIVGFILLVVSFIIILWVFSSIAFPKQIDESVCHESVILRATLGSVASGVAGEKIKSFSPLQCKTKKICLGGDCEEFSGAEYVLNIKDIDEDKDIEKEIAQEMVNCWTMMGEGKVSVFSQGAMEHYGLTGASPVCVVCSRIAINKEEVSKKVDLSKVDPVEYMLKHKVPGLEVSYYEFFSGDSSGVSVKSDLILKQSDIENDFSKDLEGVENGVENIKEDAPEIAIVFMQITSPKVEDIVKDSLYTLIGGGATAQYMSFGLAGKVLSGGVKAVGGAHSLAIASVVGAVVVGTQTYNVYNNKQIVAGYCGDVSLGDTSGCSSVRAIPYDVENLKNYCGYIDSIA